MWDGRVAVTKLPGLTDVDSSEYLNMERQWNDRSPYVNQSLFNPEWVYGVGAANATY